MKTIFCDVDGVILDQPENFMDLYTNNIILNPYGKIIPASRDKLFDWFCKGYKVILTTGRPENEREQMTKYLVDRGVYFHQLVMDCGSGIRYLINDINPHDPEVNKAVCVNLIRNKGLGDTEI